MTSYLQRIHDRKLFSNDEWFDFRDLERRRRQWARWSGFVFGAAFAFFAVWMLAR